MSNRIFDFDKSLRIGQDAELEFLKLFEDKVRKLDGFIQDFEIIRTGKTIELKTDSHDPTVTLNFFIERYSYGEEVGGPWQALKKNSTYFVFWFPITMEFYCYKTASLVDKLEELFPKPWLLNIRNKSHITRGFLVRRDLLDKIRIPIENII